MVFTLRVTYFILITLVDVGLEIMWFAMVSWLHLVACDD